MDLINPPTAIEGSRWKRGIISGLISLAILLYFWTQSRYPALTNKEGMGQGGRIELQSLGFDKVLSADPDSGFLWHAWATFVNWSATNKNGMIFGLVFAAALLTFLRHIRLGQSRFRILNTLKGVLIGAPLGVCANCVAPIGQGMYAAGEKLETVLASMVSSPTLNVVVLSLLIGLFPMEMAFTKILLTAVVLLIVVPLVTAYIARRGQDESGRDIDLVRLDRSGASGSAAESWVSAFIGVGGLFLRNLLYIVRKTFPLMVLAGLLGAMVISLFPMESLSNIEVGFAAIVGASVLGTFLPVPITFDVIIANTLMQAGLSPALVMALLFTLGIFSIYPMSIIWQSMSRFAALALFVSIGSLGVVSAYAIDFREHRQADHILAAYQQAMPTQPLEAAPKAPKDDLSTLIAKRCSAFPNQSMVVRCEVVATYSLAQEYRDISLCDGLTMDGQRRLCKHESLGAVYADKLTPQQMQKECEALITGRSAVDRCLLQIAENYKREDLCGLLEGESAQTSCRATVRIGRIADAGNPDACAELDTEFAVGRCRETTIIMQAEASLNPAICEQLAEPNVIDDCKMLALIKQMMSASRDTGICDQIEQLGHAPIAAQCRLHVQTADAVSSGDPAECGRLNDPQARTICYEQLLTLIRFLTANLHAPDSAEQLLNEFSGAIPGGDAVRPAPSPSTVATGVASDAGEVYQDGSIRITRQPHAARGSLGDKPFTRLEAGDVGIDHADFFSPLDLDEPFVYGRGIASGDIDGDGRPDLAIATREGVELYLNQGERSFARLPLDVPELRKLNAFAVALVDVNNDHRLDIFVSGYGGSDLLLLNDGARFESAGAVVRLADPEGERLLSMAAAFGDLDRDGDLDLVLGNWSFGAVAEYNPLHSKNQLFRNEGGQYVPQTLEDVRGETLSILISDIDQDNKPDLLVANDGPGPDLHYRNTGEALVMAGYGESGIPITPKYSMSYDTGDVNNDLRLDVFATDMSFSRSLVTDYCAPIVGVDAHAACQQGVDLRTIHKNYQIDRCNELKDPVQQGECRLAILVRLAVQKMQPELCERIPDTYAVERTFCRARSRLKSAPDARTKVSASYLPQSQKNVLLIGGEKGFSNHAADMGVTSSYWSWNSKFVDLNNDGWLDIYVGNGYLFNPQEIHSNVFFENQSGKKFKAAQQEFGLDDLLHTSSWTAADIDLDGDLDLIANGVLAPVRVWINNDREHNSIRFQFDDRHGNRFGIGNKVTIFYGAGGQQIRELKASGGFLSFDEPVMHFGLGDEKQVDRVVIDWSTGERTEIQRPLQANATYLVERGS